ncbi:DUF2927 domain-containing protein [Algicella marina]|uniref:DUF2927 domain-containing protein n=1 Tax=Algicella marina TaxID=2683284 RepID=A0A6P1STL6_9RHOB|nr:DUF2927 domain-containing protein [Algicella marina]QHQ34024.1 DUF2927 domain-containing protein [Algicella marina]
MMQTTVRRSAARVFRLPAFLSAASIALAACTTSPEIPDDQIADYYAFIESDLRAQGLMRQERLPNDAPVTLAALVRNFEEIALYDELAVQGNRLVERRTRSNLSRWEQPIRIGVIFGQSVPVEQARQDIRSLNAFVKDLGRYTGLPISVVEEGKPNFLLLFLNRAEQRDFGTLLGQTNIASPAIVDSFVNSPIDSLCAFYTAEQVGRPGVINSGVILIKAEHGELMRRSCIHEELTQALGLPNDSFDARPSIFNDDEEFAFLTRHDEALLRMLYDKRLKPGMSAEEVRPLLPAIARDAASRAGLPLAREVGG